MRNVLDVLYELLPRAKDAQIIHITKEELVEILKEVQIETIKSIEDETDTI